eukprot:TRINITY_DN15543_c0_g1_i1.p1 TRINITY_DN15543_c0_g1~~TRINITY_DN15543_c0_g1_i1.p1  ORF type:complete len:313 (+),score=43.25 TRINITY_DN15543_c0_g1_i1:58-939(+)
MEEVLTDIKDIAFSASRFQDNLKTRFIGRYLNYRVATETTMKLALIESGIPPNGESSWGHSKETVKFPEGDMGAPSGTIILADYQFGGVGRIVGRVWESSKNKNLLFTMILRVLSYEGIKINLLTAVSVARACKNLGVDAKIKWPNDVYVNNKKLSGYIVKVTDQYPVGSGNCVLNIGIGINVNEKMAEDEQKTSLLNALGREVDREILLAELCNIFEDLVPKSLGEVIEQYQSFDMLTGKHIIVKEVPEIEGKVLEEYEAKVIGLNGFQLRVQKKDGKIVDLVSGEVSIRPQ